MTLPSRKKRPTTAPVRPIPNNRRATARRGASALYGMTLVWCGGLMLVSGVAAAPLNWRPYRAPAIVPVTAEEMAEESAVDQTAGDDRFPTEIDHDDHFPPQMTRPNLLPQPTPARSAPRGASSRIKRASAAQPVKVRDRVLQVAAQKKDDGELFDPFADELPNNKQELDEALEGLELDSDRDKAKTATPQATDAIPDEPLPLPEATEDFFPDPDRTRRSNDDDPLRAPSSPTDRSLPSLNDANRDDTKLDDTELPIPELDDDYYSPKMHDRDDTDRQADCSRDKAGCIDAFNRMKSNTLANIDLNINVSGVEGLDYPCECPFAVGETFEGRHWPAITYNWKASGLCHKPLYFEQVAVERYGHSALPVLQDIISGAHFFASVVVLPYSMGLCPPDECQYSLGYYRPGNCAPYLIDPIPLSIRAGLFQASAIVGGILILP